jgi:predicted MFS family arabinose efflux permease
MISRAAGWLTLFLIGTDLFVMSPLLPSITREFGVPAADGGWAVTTFAAAYLVGGPSFGSLADRTSRSRVLGIGLAVFALANLATALAGSFAVLLAVRALAGLAASGVTPSVYALVGSAAPPAKRATWLAVVTSGLLTALITGAPAGTLMADVVGWRGVFVVMAIASVLILGFIWASALRPRRPAVEASGPQAEPAATAAPPPVTPPPAPVSTPLRLRAVSVTTLWALAVYGIYTYLGTILTTIAHLTSGLLAAALACFGLGAIAGNLAGGQLTDRWGGRTVSIVSLSALAVLDTVLGLTLDAPTAVLLPVLAAVALAAYPYFSAQQARLIAYQPAGSGLLIAWNNSAMYAGILIGSAVGGRVLTHLGAPALAFAAAAVAALGALSATRSIPERHRMRRRTGT